MIVAAVAAFALVCLGILGPLVLAIFNFPDEAVSMLAVALNYMTQGVAFIQQFFYWDVVTGLLAVLITIDAAYLTYRVALWVLQKIPFFGVE